MSLIRPVVTGVATITPLGRGLAATRAAIAEGHSACVHIPGHAALAARIGPFSTEPEMPKSKARRLDLGSQYTVVAARQCLADARWDLAGREERTGILLGTGSGGAGPLTELERQIVLESPEAASPFLFPNTVANAPASQAALELRIKGPNVTLIQKDPAGLNAVLYARMLLTDGRADALLVGAADEWNAVYHAAYERLHVLRTEAHPGFVLSEGASLLLLEPEESARARGATIYARVAGTSFVGRSIAPYRRAAEPADLVATMRAALADAGLSETDIGLAHLSANGSPLTDEPEAEALRQVFGNVPKVRYARVKDLLGENPSSGAAQLALAAADLRDEPALGAALVNGFGAGGNFMSVVLTAVWTA